jgi:hypothetical protein
VDIVPPAEVVVLALVDDRLVDVGPVVIGGLVDDRLVDEVVDVAFTPTQI